MKFVSFNANGIRARLHQIEALLSQHSPDVIGIQETKVDDGQFPLAELQGMGLHVEFFGQKSHYGVALLSRQPPTNVHKGFNGGDDEQKRLICADYALPDGKSVTVLNGYFPQGESRDHPVKFPNKEKYYAGVRQLLDERFQPAHNLILMGDMNVAPLDNDIGIGADNAKRWLRTGKCCFLPEEREWLDHVMQWGLKDTYRVLHPDVSDRFSWFDYRSKGFEAEPRRGLRIDLVLATAGMTAKLRDAGICYDIRSMERPSDHCPVWADFAF